MNTCYTAYIEALQKCAKNGSNPEVLSIANRFNERRREAVKARWELIVHRQAIGMIVNNHEFVMNHYPIPEAIPVTEPGKNLQNKPPPAAQKKFGDQLDWWQRVGRWK
jgi:hypothetical protein